MLADSTCDDGDDGDEEKDDDEYDHQAAHIVFTERERPPPACGAVITLYTT